MTHPASPLVVADDREARLHQRRIDSLVEVGRGPLLASVAMYAFLFAVAVRSGSVTPGLVAWGLAVVGHATFHEVLRARYRQDPHRLPPDQWEPLFALGALWAATLLAAWYWAFMPWDEPIAVTMVIAVSVANWVGAAVNMAASSHAFTAYSIAVLLGPIGALLVRGGDFRVVGVMGAPLGVAIVITHLDIRAQLIERIREREELALLTAQQAAVFDTIAEAVLTVDGGVIGMCNARFLSLVARPRDECEGRPVESVIPDLGGPEAPCDGRPIPATLPATANRGRLHLELRGHEVDGHHDHQVWVCTDVSDRVRREHEMDVLASQDDLTGFLNRRALHERLRRDFASSEPPEGLMLVDLDGFKAVNDRHGHAVGDVVLARLSTRLRDGLAGVVLGRIGGDEFVVVVGSGGRFAVEGAADAVCRLCREPVEVSGVALRVAASVGVVWVTPGLDVANALLLADQAMYRAKQAGGDRWTMASPPEEPMRSLPSPPSNGDASPPRSPPSARRPSV
jgi:diguanylate cyclase (GGDEF)-like protein